MALAKSQAYQDAADAPATLRAYTADLANYKAWCEKHWFEPMPATPEVVGPTWLPPAKTTRRRRVAATSTSREHSLHKLLRNQTAVTIRPQANPNLLSSLEIEGQRSNREKTQTCYGDPADPLSGRGAGRPAPPPQIPACGFPAPGSCRRSNVPIPLGLAAHTRRTRRLTASVTC